MTATSAGRPGAPLYTTEILALAVELAEYPLTDAVAQRGEAASRVCGSRVVIDAACAADGTIRRVGAQVAACAIGQASATLFLRGAPGRSAGDLAAAIGDIESWLAGADARPAWPGLSILEPARSYPARHAAILLPWRAALAALSKLPRAD